MFERKYLKQLKKTQSLIKHYKESIKKLNPPALEFKISNELYKCFEALSCGYTDVLADFCKNCDEATYEYLSKLGMYLMYVSDHRNTRKMYEKQISQLQTEERELKTKLGIE